MLVTRVLRVLGLLLVVAVTALFSGGPAGAGPTTAAIVRAAVAALPADLRTVPVAAPAGPVPAAAAAPAEELPEPAQESPAEAGAADGADDAEDTGDTGDTADEEPATERDDGALVAGTPCSAAARACIELSSNRSWLISGGEVVY